MHEHFRVSHPTVNWSDYRDRYSITDAEQSLLRKVWDTRLKQKKTYKKKMGTLELSDAHSSRMGLR
jgi:hypothetical protein